MEESSGAGIHEKINAYIIDVNENSEIQREANTSIGNESQNEELLGEVNASSKNEDQDTTLANVMREMRESSKFSSNPSLSRKCCIYKVPRELRNSNREAYTPQVISIGPFTKSAFKRFETMEKLKVIYFNRFVEEAARNEEDLVRKIREMEQEVRHSYAETSNLSSDDYVKMILLDASFIIMLFCMSKLEGHHLRDDDDSKEFTPRLMSTIVNDMWLLENQLPFFVIEEIYNFAFPNRHDSFTSLTIEFFADYNTRKMYDDYDLEIKHFLDLLRTFYVPPSHFVPQRKDVIGAKDFYTANVNQLHEAGVKFKVGNEECLFDLNFTNGVLEIPCLVLNGSTESLFRNLVAWEQFHYPYDAHVTDYIRVLNFLIDTAKDVDLLVQKKIMVNGLGHSKAVATLVNNLCKHIASFDVKSDYCQLYKDLNEFHANPRHGWKASLRRDYFNNPWRAAATLAAIILLVLTFTQTVCSIISLRSI